MSEQLLSPENMHETIATRIAGLYPEYMEMIRAFVSEGIIEVDEPTDKQRQWADMAALGNKELGHAVALLARVTEQAHKQRYLEGMPMLIDFDSPMGGEHNGFESIERFHFLRLFAKDQKALRQVEPTEGLAGVPIVLYMQPS